MDETERAGGLSPSENGNGARPRGDRARRRAGWAALDAAWSQAGALEPGLDPTPPGWRVGVDHGEMPGWAEPASRYAVPSDAEPPMGDHPASAPPASASAPPGGTATAPVPVPGGPAQPDPSAPDGPAVAVSGRVTASASTGHGGWRPERPRIPGARPAPPQERDVPVPEEPPGQAGLDDVTPAEGLPLIHQPRWEGQPAPTDARAPELYAVPAPAEQPGASLPERSDSAQQRHAESPPSGYAGGPPSGYAVPPGFRPRQPAAEHYGTDPDAGEPAYRPDEPFPPAGPARKRTAPTRGPAPPPPPPPPAPPPSGPGGELADALPQRVPAEPDVPTVPEPPAAEPPAEAPELARIATHLRHYDASPQPRERLPGFDVAAVLAAVRGVFGVRDASLRTSPGGGHTLRLDLAEGADPAQISREVTRLLQERMGLAAAPRGGPQPSGQPRGPSGQRPARGPETPTQTRRWQPPATVRGRATPERAAGAAVQPEQVGSAQQAARPGPLNVEGRPGRRVVIDQVQVGTFGLDASVEVCLLAGDKQAVGLAGGPATEAYVTRLCAVAAASAIDQLLRDAYPDGELGRCVLEHATVVQLGGCEVAVAVVLLMCGEGGWVEQLAGSAVVAGDPRQAVVRATLAAVNRRLEALLA